MVDSHLRWVASSKLREYSPKEPILFFFFFFPHNWLLLRYLLVHFITLREAFHKTQPLNASKEFCLVFSPRNRQATMLQDHGFHPGTKKMGGRTCFSILVRGLGLFHLCK